MPPARFEAAEDAHAMTARLLMNDRPVSLRETDSLRDAAQIILTHHFRNVPVVAVLDA